MNLFVTTDRCREMEVEEGLSIDVLLGTLGINSEEVLVSLNGALVTEEEVLSEGDRLTILSVISGG
jgi:thiamine biosynthesis protein ThiS